MAAGAAELYVKELSRIGALSQAGAAQLAADLDYFCNVLAALGVSLPPQLVTWQARAAQQRNHSWRPRRSVGTGCNCVPRSEEEHRRWHRDAVCSVLVSSTITVQVAVL